MQDVEQVNPVLLDQRQVLDVQGPSYERRHILSLSPFRPLIKDYFLICESYYQAIRNSTPSPNPPPPAKRS